MKLEPGRKAYQKGDKLSIEHFVVRKIDGGMEYIFEEEVTALMDEAGMLLKFKEWFVGQTAPIVDGKFGIYAHDVQRFLEGKEVLD